MVRHGNGSAGRPATVRHHDLVGSPHVDPNRAQDPISSPYPPGRRRRASVRDASTHGGARVIAVAIGLVLTTGTVAGTSLLRTAANTGPDDAEDPVQALAPPSTDAATTVPVLPDRLEPETAGSGSAALPDEFAFSPPWDDPTAGSARAAGPAATGPIGRPGPGTPITQLPVAQAPVTQLPVSAFAAQVAVPVAQAAAPIEPAGPRAPVDRPTPPIEQVTRPGAVVAAPIAPLTGPPDTPIVRAVAPLEEPGAQTDRAQTDRAPADRPAAPVESPVVAERLVAPPVEEAAEPAERVSTPIAPSTPVAAPAAPAARIVAPPAQARTAERTPDDQAAVSDRQPDATPAPSGSRADDAAVDQRREAARQAPEAVDTAPDGADVAAPASENGKQDPTDQPGRHRMTSPADQEPTDEKPSSTEAGSLDPGSAETETETGSSESAAGVPQEPTEQEPDGSGPTADDPAEEDSHSDDLDRDIPPAPGTTPQGADDEESSGDGGRGSGPDLPGHPEADVTTSQAPFSWFDA